MESEAITNLIALGDNVFEIEAAYILGGKFKSAFIKTVKFRMSPSPNELIKQIKLVLTQFELICNSPKNLTVRLLKQNKNEEEAAQRAANTKVRPVQTGPRSTSMCDEATLASTNIMKNYNQQRTLSPRGKERIKSKSIAERL